MWVPLCKQKHIKCGKIIIWGQIDMKHETRLSADYTFLLAL